MQDWNLLKVYFVVFGFLALSSVILFEFFRIFLTWVNIVPEIFLHLGIQVKINIANREEEVMGLRLLGSEKESWPAYNNVERSALEMDIEGILVDLRNSFL